MLQRLVVHVSATVSLVKMQWVVPKFGFMYAKYLLVFVLQPCRPHHFLKITVRWWWSPRGRGNSATGLVIHTQIAEHAVRCAVQIINSVNSCGDGVDWSDGIRVVSSFRKGGVIAMPHM